MYGRIRLRGFGRNVVLLEEILSISVFEEMEADREES